ncbi:O-methyltransferase [Ureaplasma zalophigenitalium]|uniref:Methyltransferase n=1 Tax=Ureaplasma zalophigenitalium TaxID=907723 RepID=A0ABT3BP52_9BACT|nr:methyltransferase [Ureaplasma zalophigenitalium]MCV3754006.1 methyltransferase [Ureaplasma zalophigenitalium]
MQDKLIQIRTLRALCVQDKIPLMREQTIDYIIEQMNLHGHQFCLEIGTAYGYSALNIKTFVPTLKTLITLEKDLKRIQIAENFLANEPNFTLVHTDCFHYQPDQLFDVIILDGPKGKQIELFNKYIHFLKPQGQMFIDNLFLNTLRQRKELSKNQVKLLAKVDAFVDYLKNIADYQFTILNIDDGLGIITKK